MMTFSLDTNEDTKHDNSNTDCDNLNEYQENKTDMTKIYQVLDFISNLLKNLKIEDENLSQGIEFISDQLKF